MITFTQRLAEPFGCAPLTTVLLRPILSQNRLEIERENLTLRWVDHNRRQPRMVIGDLTVAVRAVTDIPKIPISIA